MERVLFIGRVKKENRNSKRKKLDCGLINIKVTC